MENVTPFTLWSVSLLAGNRRPKVLIFACLDLQRAKHISEILTFLALGIRTYETISNTWRKIQGGIFFLFSELWTEASNTWTCTLILSLVKFFFPSNWLSYITVPKQREIKFKGRITLNHCTVPLCHQSLWPVFNPHLHIQSFPCDSAQKHFYTLDSLKNCHGKV